MRVVYNPESSFHDLERHYRQSGNGLNYFQGSINQRGHGLGDIFSSLFRSALPVLKRTLGTFGHEALRAGTGMIKDVIAGKKLSESFKERAPGVINRSLDTLVEQSGSGFRRRRRGAKRKVGKRQSKKRVKRRRHNNNKDIFA